VAAVAGFLLVLPIERFLIELGIGDALAYPRVAWHVAAGRGSTYDAVTATNGYHPLWMWLHVPLMLGADSILERMPVVRLLWVGAALASIALWSTWFGRLTGDPLAKAVLIAVMGSFGWSLYVLYAGPETPLVVLLLGATLWLAQELADRPAPSRTLCLGFAGGAAATVLARIDAAIVIAPLFALVTIRVARQVRARAATMVAVTLAALAPYLAWNLTRFGGLLPVSGRVKLAGGVDAARGAGLVASWAERVGLAAPPGAAIAAAAVGCAGVGAAFVLVRRLPARDRARLRILLWLPAGALAHYLISFVALREVNVPWHLYLAAVSAYLAVAVVALGASRAIDGSALASGRKAASRVLVFTLLLAVSLAATAVYAHAKRQRRGEVRAAVAVAAWLAANHPDARVAMYDSFWVGAWAPQLELIDLNGLVGDAAIARRIARGAAREVVADYGCAYVVTRVAPACADEVAYAFLSPATAAGWRLAVLEVGRGRDVPASCGGSLLSRGAGHGGPG
jgi:hypothetical protein